MEQYVGKLHFLLRYCEITLAKHHTTFNNSSCSILIAKSENMARISNDFYELLLLIHWNFGDIFLEEGPDYLYNNIVLSMLNAEICPKVRRHNARPGRHITWTTQYYCYYYSESECLWWFYTLNVFGDLKKWNLSIKMYW